MAKNLILVTAAFLFVVTVGFELGSANAYAATKKIDCTKVMSELQGGKKVKEVAKDMSISTSSVYRCRKMAKTSTMKKTASSASASSSSSTSAPSSAATPSTSKSGY